MKLLLVGDVMIGRLVNEALALRPKASIWGDTLPWFEPADLRVANLECAVTGPNTPRSEQEKAFYFRSDPENVAALAAARIDVVSVANNHILDHGAQGLVDTLHHLDRAGIRHAGAGRDVAEAIRPAVVTVQGLRFGLLACTDNEPGWEATLTKPGTCYVPDDLADERTRALLDRVAALRAELDFVIVSLHWGSNWGYEPPERHVALARALIERGADLIHGHSCHVVRGIEIYRGRPILYGTGDFVDDYAVDPVERNDRSAVFVVDVAPTGTVTELRLHPTVIRDCRAEAADRVEALTIAQTLRDLCRARGTETAWDGATLTVPVASPS